MQLRCIELEVQVDNAFRNIHLGDWQGKRKRDLARQQPDDWRMWTMQPDRFIPPNGESIGKIQDRAWAGLESSSDAMPNYPP